MDDAPALGNIKTLPARALVAECEGLRMQNLRQNFGGYLRAVHAESLARDYRFDKGKIGRSRTSALIDVASGQLDFEWRHLMKKLEVRSPELHERLMATASPEPHPLFRVTPGEVADWERP